MHTLPCRPGFPTGKSAQPHATSAHAVHCSVSITSGEDGMKIRLLVLVTCALAGSYLAGQNKSRTSSAGEEIPEIHGFDMSAMDRTAAPCDDFYQFVCGNWIKTNAIPPDQGRWGRFNQLAERNRLVAKQILEKASADDPKRDAVHQK